MLKTTTSRLAFTLLGYVILVLLLLTFNPFYVAIPRHINIYYGTNLPDLIVNICMFLPVGFFYRMATKRRDAWLFGAIVSTCIELLQIFVPARTPSPVDVLNNVIGAALGALMYDPLFSRLARLSKMVSNLRLDAPLMGFLYLLIPLLWVNSVAMVRVVQRWPLTLLIGICGAIVFNDLFRKGTTLSGLRLTVYASLSAGVWFLFGAGISLLRPVSSIFIIMAVVLLTALLTVLPRRFPDRRFERATLRRALPVFMLYVALLALWSPDRPLVPWHGIFGLTDRITESNTHALLTRMQYLAAFSILGYLVAEWRGRAELSIAHDLPGLLTIVGGFAFLLEVLVGFQSGMGASLVRFLLVTAGGLYGGIIYHRLRDHIRFVRGHGGINS